MPPRIAGRCTQTVRISPHRLHERRSCSGPWRNAERENVERLSLYGQGGLGAFGLSRRGPAFGADSHSQLTSNRLAPGSCSFNPAL